MLRRRIYIFIGILIVITIGFLVTAYTYPKELIRFPVYVLVLLADLYLWTSIRKMVKSWKRVPGYIFAGFYWLPMVLVMILGLISLSISPYQWPPVITNLFGGIILITYLSKLTVVFFFLLADLIKILRHAVRFAYHKKTMKPCPEKANQMSRASFLKNLGLIGGGFVLSGMIIGAVRWAYDFRIRHELVRFPVLPEELQGLKIIHISDLHLGSWANKQALIDAMEVINDEKADFIFFTGDLVNFLTKEAYAYKNILSQLKARYGVYAVLGNHDYGDYVKWATKAEKEKNLRDLELLYSEMGWLLLRNQNSIIDVHGRSLAIVGVENWSAYDRFPRYGDISRALKGTQMADFKILLSHDPTHWDQVISQQHPDIHITLSGHTHGFQFGVELKNFRWSPAQYMYKRWAGIYDNPATDSPQYLYVNRGLGMIGYPGRIGILPEIAVLELVT